MYHKIEKGESVPQVKPSFKNCPDNLRAPVRAVMERIMMGVWKQTDRLLEVFTVYGHRLQKQGEVDGSIVIGDTIKGHPGWSDSIKLDLMLQSRVINVLIYIAIGARSKSVKIPLKVVVEQLNPSSRASVAKPGSELPSSYVPTKILYPGRPRKGVQPATSVPVAVKIEPKKLPEPLVPYVGPTPVWKQPTFKETRKGGIEDRQFVLDVLMAVRKRSDRVSCFSGYSGALPKEDVWLILGTRWGYKKMAAARFLAALVERHLLEFDDTGDFIYVRSKPSEKKIFEALYGK